MKFSDLFAPKILNSNPDVRKKAIAQETDKHLLRQIIEKDNDEGVRNAARERLNALIGEAVTA